MSMGQVEPKTADSENPNTLSSAARLFPGMQGASMLDLVADEEIAEVAQRLLENVQAQGRAADEKVRALFSTNSIFVAVIAIGSTGTVSQLTVQPSNELSVLGLVLRGLLLLSMAVSTASSVLGLLPRVDAKGEPERSLFFFGTIASLPKEQFVQEFRSLSVTNRAEQLLSQVHINSQIVQVKYKWIRRSATFLLVGVALWLLVLALTFLL